MSDATDRYPMCSDQPAQIDCRMTDCSFHADGTCTNPSPAISLNIDGRFICWTQKSLSKPELVALRALTAAAQDMLMQIDAVTPLLPPGQYHWPYPMRVAVRTVAAALDMAAKVVTP